jgi:hypothetical protein
MTIRCTKKKDGKEYERKKGGEYRFKRNSRTSGG